MPEKRAINEQLESYKIMLPTTLSITITTETLLEN